MNLLRPKHIDASESAAILLVRLVMGAAFILHGWPKIQHATTWMNAMGSSMPGPIQALSALLEFGGGILLLLGLITPLGALAIVLQMIGALSLVHLPHHDPFVAVGKTSFELPLLYLVVAGTILATGPGAFSLDALFFHERVRPETTFHGERGPHPAI